MRFVALDSLRGIAAMCVVFYHSILVFPALEPLHEIYVESGEPLGLLLTAMPPSLLWAGREAVLLFFVLSGFVLALSLQGGPHGRPVWLAFAAKRMVRLLIPCAAVAGLLAVVVPLADPAPEPELSRWFNQQWREPVTPSLVLGHAFLVLPEYSLNTPMWTLHYELRISLILPFMVLLAAFGSHVLLAATIAGVLACLVEMKFLGTGALTTLLFLPHFTFGVLIARHRDALAGGIARLGRVAKGCLWGLCYLLLNFRWLVQAPGLVWDIVSGLGGALLIALVLGSRRAQSVLCSRPLPQLGAISYSLYLVHVPVLLAGLYLAPVQVPAWLVAVVSPVASVLLAIVLYRLVERPAIVLSRRTAEWLEGRRRAAASFGASR